MTRSSRRSKRGQSPRAPGPLPEELRQLLDEHHVGGIAASDCLRCSAPCCMQSGFALLPNVELIYRRYRDGDLRLSFELKPGLDLAGFVASCFDVSRGSVGRGRELTLFHPRSLGPCGQPIAVPPSEDTFETRAALFDGNLWLNRGCIFLSIPRPPWPEDDGRRDRRCTLHDGAQDGLSAKPIDCLLLTCDRPGSIREPAPRFSERWFQALARAFPDRG